MATIGCTLKPVDDPNAISSFERIWSEADNMTFLADLLELGTALPDAELVKLADLMDRYEGHFNCISNHLYTYLSEQDRRRFVIWFLKRWGKIDVVGSDERSAYLDVVEKAFASYGEESIGDTRYILRRYEEAGYGFELLGYDWFTGVHDILFDQYATESFDVKRGDVIIDGGAFIGDTAVLFNAKTEGQCQVHAFELLDENLVLAHRNLELNGLLGKVVLNKLALSDTSGQVLSIAQTRLQASTSLLFPGEVEVNTITVDEYVERSGIERVDFIKLDIEGAEIPALEGARGTIEKHRPRLALCLYHKWDDVLTIPAFLASLSFEYEYRFKWVHLKLGTEAVILLTPRAAMRSQEDRASTEVVSFESSAINLLRAYRKKYKQADDLWQAKKAERSSASDNGHEAGAT